MHADSNGGLLLRPITQTQGYRKACHSAPGSHSVFPLFVSFVDIGTASR